MSSATMVRVNGKKLSVPEWIEPSICWIAEDEKRTCQVSGRNCKGVLKCTCIIGMSWSRAPDGYWLYSCLPHIPHHAYHLPYQPHYGARDHL